MRFFRLLVLVRYFLKVAEPVYKILFLMPDIHKRLRGFHRKYKTKLSELDKTRTKPKLNIICA